jgi:hypothetical protein
MRYAQCAVTVPEADIRSRVAAMADDGWWLSRALRRFASGDVVCLFTRRVSRDEVSVEERGMTIKEWQDDLIVNARCGACGGYLNKDERRKRGLPTVAPRDMELIR